MEDAGVFYGNFVYFTAILVNFVAIWYILWSFGIFYGYLVYFFLFWYVVPKNLANLRHS
jgi:hypothetical protein